ncbi:MAG TPA: ABC transporter permease [Streptosporangiaceae bacterium]
MTDQKTPLRARLAGRAGRDPAAGRLAGPGQLRTTDLGVEAGGGPDGLSLTEYALEHGLRPSAERPSISEYLRQLWRRVNFIVAFATARNVAMYTEAKLGQLWQVLTPLLNAGVYFLIFGLLLHINRGVPNYLGFLVTGVFVFNFTQRAFISTSTVMTDSLELIRALHFPRASLPLAYVMIEFQQMLLSMVVLIPILLLTGEPLTWYWLLAIPALLLQTIFNVGIGLGVARLGSQVNDFSQLLPFLMRTWLYVSGVLFSIQTLFHAASSKVITLLELNPAALYITLVRNAVLASQRESAPGSKPFNLARCTLWHTLGNKKGAPEKYQFYSAYCHYVGANPAHFWYYAIGWSVIAVVVGFCFFWRAETRYGRG